MASGKENILILDNGHTITTWIKNNLEARGYNPTRLDPSQDILEKAQKCSPDVIILDISDSYAGISLADSLLSLLSCPFLITATYKDLSVLKENLPEDRLTYLVKPFNYIELQSSIEIILLKQSAKNKINTYKDALHVLLYNNQRHEISEHREHIEELFNEYTSEFSETIEMFQNEITERKRVVSELITSQNRLEYVKQIGALAASSLKLDEVLEYILKGTLEASGATAGMILLKDRKTGSFSLSASMGLSEEFNRKFSEKDIGPGECLAGRIAESGNPLYIKDAFSHDPRIRESAISGENLNSLIGVPIFATNEVVGVLKLMTSPPDIMSEQEITLASAIGAYVGSAIRNAQQYEQRVQIENQLLEYQKQLQSLTSKIALIEENEKRRIASELHDCIGQSLALSKIKLGMLSKKASSDENRQIIIEILQLIEQTIKETRTLTFELSPPILYELGLSQAIKWLVDEFQKKYGLHTTIKDNKQDMPFDNSTRFFLFQSVRELLVNIVKHSGTDRASITMQNKKGKLLIIIEDGGAGFEASKIDYSGFGLFNIRERMNHINGGFEIQSEPGRGTRITLMAPFNTQNSIHTKGMTFNENKNPVSR